MDSKTGTFQALDPAILGRDFQRFKKKETEIHPSDQNERGSISKLWLGVFLLLASLGALTLYPLLTRGDPKQPQKPPTLKKNQASTKTQSSILKKKRMAPSLSKTKDPPPVSPRAQQEGGGLFGEVRDIFERPIPGARIQVKLGGRRGKELTTITNSKGEYRVPLKKKGIVFVFVRHPDFAPPPQPLYLEPKGSKPWVRIPKITLLSGKKLVFRFLTPGGHPISSVRAILQEKLGGDRGPFADPPKEALSDPAGIVQFLGLPPNSGDQRFELRILPPPPWIRSLLHFWPHPTGGSPISITLLEGTSLRGRVEDAFGRPSAKAEVRALPLGSIIPAPVSATQVQKEGRRPPQIPSNSKAQTPIPCSVSSDDQGRFLLGGLPKGPCQILVHPNLPKPRIWASKRVLIPSRKLLVLRLPKGGRLDVRLPTKLPFSAFVFLRTTTGRGWSPVSSWKKIPKSPRFYREALPREILRIRLRNSLGFDFTSDSLDFETLEHLDLDLETLEAATLQGWVKGKGHNPPGGPLRARLISPSPTVLSLGTISKQSSMIPLDGDGHFVLGPVPAGTYEILWGSRSVGRIHLNPGESLEKTFSLP